MNLQHAVKEMPTYTVQKISQRISVAIWPLQRKPEHTVKKKQEFKPVLEFKTTLRRTAICIESELRTHGKRL